MRGETPWDGVQGDPLQEAGHHTASLYLVQTDGGLCSPDLSTDATLVTIHNASLSSLRLIFAISALQLVISKMLKSLSFI